MTAASEYDHRRSALTRLASRTGASLRFSDISVDVKGKRVLNGVSGAVERGELLAVMGPSGSGKSTLFNVLAGRLPAVSGEIHLDNKPLNKSLRRQMCYVLQHDLLFPYLTLFETFKYAALLRLPQAMSYESKMEVVEEVIEVLGVKHCKNTIIGNHVKRGLSGGEKKRASIGQELLANPRLLVMDEPTSGLDSHIAHSLLVTIKNLVEQHGRTIITSIHQPSSQIFHLFNKLLLLSEGRVVYYGSGKEAVSYFSRLGYECPLNYNPADYLLDVVSNGEAMKAVLNKKHSPLALESSGKEAAARQFSLGNQHEVAMMTNSASSDGVASALATFDDVIESALESVEDEQSEPSQKLEVQVSTPPRKSIAEFDEGARWPSSFHTQFSVLVRRSFKNSRSEILSLVNAAQVVALTILSGFLWFRPPRNEDHIRDITGYLFFMAVFFGFQPMILATGTFLVEKTVINRERASGYYRLSAYFLAKTVSEIPLVFVLPTMYLAITYPLTNLGGASQFFQIWCFLMLGVLVAQSFGQCVGAIAPTIQKAVTTASTLMIAFLLLGGFYVSQFSPNLSWLKFLSYCSYMYHAFALIVFNDSVTYSCALNNPGSPYPQCLADPVKANMSGNATLPAYGNATISGTEIVEELGSTVYSLGMVAGVLVGLIIVLRMVTYSLLRWVRKPSVA